MKQVSWSNTNPVAVLTDLRSLNKAMPGQATEKHVEGKYWQFTRWHFLSHSNPKPKMMQSHFSAMTSTRSSHI